MTGSAPDSRVVYDVGLQPERTALAWRRTALSLLVTSLGAARVLPPQLGTGAVAIGVAGTLWAVALHLLAGRRTRRASARLISSGDLAHRQHSAHLLAATAAVTGLLGLGGLALVLLRARG